MYLLFVYYMRNNLCFLFFLSFFSLFFVWTTFFLIIIFSVCTSFFFFMHLWRPNFAYAYFSCSHKELPHASDIWYGKKSSDVCMSSYSLFDRKSSSILKLFHFEQCGILFCIIEKSQVMDQFAAPSDVCMSSYLFCCSKCSYTFWILCLITNRRISGYLYFPILFHSTFCISQYS